MARDFTINGETMVNVKGTQASTVIGGSAQLGLTDRQGTVRIRPRWKHKDIFVDDFGPNVPVELMWQLADVTISMTLVHFDEAVLEECTRLSMAGANRKAPWGTLAAYGTLMGNNAPILAQSGSPSSGQNANNSFISLGITSPVLNLPWRFPAACLITEPLEYPIGVNRTAAQLMWRAIPYIPVDTYIQQLGIGGECLSSGVVLWDRQVNTAIPGQL